MNPDIWRKVGIFRHGAMHKPEYAIAVVTRLANLAGMDPAGALLELGPGDSVATAVIGSSLGFDRVDLVDVGDDATSDVEVYKQLASTLAQSGSSPPSLHQAASRDDVLAACRARYLTQGIRSLRDLPPQSYDVVWSNAVLEHVRKSDVNATLAELRRVIKPSGVMVHTIDYRDHLGGSLHNLRFPSSLWEQDWFAHRSGFYTNRLRHHQFLAYLTEVGFTTTCVERHTWHNPPLRTQVFAPEFRSLTRDELLVSSATLRSRPRTARLRRTI